MLSNRQRKSWRFCGPAVIHSAVRMHELARSCGRNRFCLIVRESLGGSADPLSSTPLSECMKHLSHSDDDGKLTHQMSTPTWKHRFNMVWQGSWPLNAKLKWVYAALVIDQRCMLLRRYIQHLRGDFESNQELITYYLLKCQLQNLESNKLLVWLVA